MINQVPGSARLTGPNQYVVGHLDVAKYCSTCTDRDTIPNFRVPVEGVSLARGTERDAVQNVAVVPNRARLAC